MQAPQRFSAWRCTARLGVQVSCKKCPNPDSVPFHCCVLIVRSGARSLGAWPQTIFPAHSGKVSKSREISEVSILSEASPSSPHPAHSEKVSKSREISKVSIHPESRARSSQLRMILNRDHQTTLLHTSGQVPPHLYSRICTYPERKSTASDPYLT